MSIKAIKIGIILWIAFLVALSGSAFAERKVFINNEWVSVDKLRQNSEEDYESYMERGCTPGEYKVLITQAEYIPPVQVFARVVHCNPNGVWEVVTGLTEQNFRLHEGIGHLDNGTCNASGKKSVVDYVVVENLSEWNSASISLGIDISGSMSGGALEEAKTKLKEFLNNVSPADRIGLVSFESTAKIEHDFSFDTASLTSAVDALTTMGSTALLDAICLSLDEVVSQNGAKAVVVFTDGQENQSQNCTTVQQVIDKAKSYFIPVYTIGVGSGTDSNYLQTIADATNGKFYNAPSASDLAAIYDEITHLIQSQYVINYRSPFPESSGIDRCGDVQVILPGGTQIDPAAYSYTISGTDSISLSLSTETRSLIYSGSGNDIPMPISVEVVSPNESVEGFLYWRPANGDFEKIPLQINARGTSSGLYKATIAKENVIEPGIAFFVEFIGDSTGTRVTLPTVGPQTNPYTIAISPNAPPVISTNSFPANFDSSQDLKIKFRVFDETDETTEANVYTRKVRVGGHSFPFNKIAATRTSGSAQSGNWEATIPVKDLGGLGIEVFITATDNFGIKGYYATMDYPRRILPKETVKDPGDGFTLPYTMGPFYLTGTDSTSISPASRDETVYKYKISGGLHINLLGNWAYFEADNCTIDLQFPPVMLECDSSVLTFNEEVVLFQDKSISSLPVDPAIFSSNGEIRHASDSGTIDNDLLDAFQAQLGANLELFGLAYARVDNYGCLLYDTSIESFFIGKLAQMFDFNMGLTNKFSGKPQIGVGAVGVCPNIGVKLVDVKVGLKVSVSDWINPVEKVSGGFNFNIKTSDAPDRWKKNLGFGDHAQMLTGSLKVNLGCSLFFAGAKENCQIDKVSLPINKASLGVDLHWPLVGIKNWGSCFDMDMDVSVQSRLLLATIPIPPPGFPLNLRFKQASIELASAGKMAAGIGKLLGADSWNACPAKDTRFTVGIGLSLDPAGIDVAQKIGLGLKGSLDFSILRADFNGWAEWIDGQVGCPLCSMGVDGQAQLIYGDISLTIPLIKLPISAKGSLLKLYGGVAWKWDWPQGNKYPLALTLEGVTETTMPGIPGFELFKGKNSTTFSLNTTPFKIEAISGGIVQAMIPEAVGKIFPGLGGKVLSSAKSYGKIKIDGQDNEFLVVGGKTVLFGKLDLVMKLLINKDGVDFEFVGLEDIPTHDVNINALVKGRLRGKLAAVDPETGEHIFQLLGNEDSIAVFIGWENEQSGFKLVDPDGAEIFPGEKVEDLQISIVNWTDGKGAFAVIGRPKAGIYKIVPDDPQNSQLQVAVKLVTKSAMLNEVTKLSASGGSEGAVDLEWELSDLGKSIAEDKQATLHVFLDTDNQGEDGTLIGSLNAKDGSGNLTLKGFRPGKYYFYSLMVTGEGLPSATYSKDPLSVSFSGRPDKVEDLEVETADNDTVDLQWSSIGGVSGYRVYLSDSAEKSINTKQVPIILYGSDITKYNFTKLVPGGKYLVAVSAFNSQGEGELSDVKDFTYLASNTNNNPSFDYAKNQLPLAIPAKKQFSAQLKATDPDQDEEIRFQIAEGPDAMSIESNTGIINWTPKSTDIGHHKIAFRVVDERGGSDYYQWEFAVTNEWASDQVTLEDPNKQEVDVDISKDEGCNCNTSQTNGSVAFMLMLLGLLGALRYRKVRQAFNQMKNTSLIGICIVLSSAFIFASCESSGDDCTVDTDCSSGQTCVDGSCYASCKSNKDCETTTPASRPYSLGFYKAEDGSTDGDDGQTTEDEKAAPETEDGDTAEAVDPEKLVCHPAYQACKPKCATDEDCPNAKCDSGYCLGENQVLDGDIEITEKEQDVPPAECNEGDRKCEKTVAYACENGKWIVAADCAELNATCKEGKCKAGDPNLPKEDGDTEAGEGGEETDKPIGPQTCATDQTKCEGTVIQYCAFNKWNSGTDCKVYGLICHYFSEDGEARCTTEDATDGDKDTGGADGDAVSEGDTSPPVDGDTETTTCTDWTKKCIGTILYYCYQNKWNEQEDCDNSGKICVYDHCESQSVDGDVVTDGDTTPPVDGDTSETETDTGCVQDTYEPGDNSINSSTHLEISTPQNNHSICPIGDVDYYYFILSGTKKVTITTYDPDTSYNTTDDTEIWLYNYPSNNLIAYDNNGGNYNFAKIDQQTLPSGTYIVKVTERNNDETIEKYGILMQQASVTVDGDTEIEAEVEYEMEYEVEAEMDVSKESCCTPHSSPGCNIPSVESCVCGYMSSCCTSEWTDTCVTYATHTSLSCKHVCDVDGDVSETETTDTTENSEVSCTTDNYEYDGSTGSATTLNFNSSQSDHSIYSATDNDYYKFTLGSSYNVEIYTYDPYGNYNDNTEMWLLNSSGSSIEYDSNNGTNSYSKINMYLTSGTYYVRVRDYGGNDIICNYGIRLNVTSPSVDGDYEVEGG